MNCVPVLSLMSLPQTTAFSGLWKVLLWLGPWQWNCFLTHWNWCAWLFGGRHLLVLFWHQVHVSWYGDVTWSRWLPSWSFRYFFFFFLVMTSYHFALCNGCVINAFSFCVRVLHIDGTEQNKTLVSTAQPHMPESWCAILSVALFKCRRGYLGNPQLIGKATWVQGWKARRGRPPGTSCARDTFPASSGLK